MRKICGRIRSPRFLLGYLARAHAIGTRPLFSPPLLLDLGMRLVARVCIVFILGLCIVMIFISFRSLKDPMMAGW